MKIFIASALVPGRVPIHDDGPHPALRSDEEYQLLFTSGKNTLKAFKQLYLEDRDALFCVKNLEHFFSVFKLFRNVETVLYKESGKPKAAAKQKRRGKPARGASRTLEESMARYCEIEAELRNEKIGRAMLNDPAAELGVRISFFPNIVDSIKTSLLRPAVYRSPELLCHSIVSRLLEKPLKLAELQEVGDAQNVEKTLKSLVFAGVVKKKDSQFHINGLFKN
ncbi:hypothetical protein PAPHI01_0449 [Pancytospora philotis]|nr:hypothetical protein PAPHI01_0449 [Pancytospora philotis]